MNVTKRMPSFEGVAGGSTATLRCPIGLSYHQLLISYSGVTLAQMSEIRVLGNGKAFMRFTSGTRLNAINLYHNRATASGIIVVDFIRNSLRTESGEMVTVLGTGAPSKDGSVELSTLAVEIDIAAAATAPALSAKAIQSAPQNLGFIKHVREYGYNPAAVGEFEIADIPKGHLFSSVHFVSANMTALRVERDGYIVFERNAAENTLIQSDGKYKVPQSGIFTFDPSEIGLGGNTLQTGDVFDLRFIATMSSAGALPVVVESIAPLN